MPEFFSSKMSFLYRALLSFFLIGFFTNPSFAKESSGSYLLAQNMEDDAYDPFSDYSEFDEASDEEADINFFRNGRFLSLGVDLGAKGFTDNLGSAYGGGGTYGFFLDFFYDLRFALQFGLNTGDYPFSFSSIAGDSISGDVSFTNIQVAAKYYFNTQNITKGLAELNPYMIAGVSDFFRTYTVTSTVTNQMSSATISAWGLDIGGGIEIPTMRKKAFYGVQATFHYINFADSNSALISPNSGQPATMTQRGYQYDLLGIFGVNF